MKILYGSELVTELRKNCDRIKQRLWIAVPYIGGLNTVRRIFGRPWIENSRLSIRLLTDTNEFSNFNSETVKLFHQLGHIKHLEGLHAKIFITDNTCLITSANLTHTAFTKRHEIGIFLDEEHSAKTISIFTAWWNKAEEVPIININKYSNIKIESSEEHAGSFLKKLWTLPEDPGEINYWLKPIGVTGHPITEDRVFDQLEDNLHFHWHPKSVEINDILIGYGIGAHRILSIYQVTSKGIQVTEDEIAEDGWLERWSWYVTAKNLTPNFGKKWAEYNLYASDLLHAYLKENTEGYITKVKGKTLGGLNFRRDKINLDPDFARFIIRHIKDIDSKLK